MTRLSPAQKETLENLRDLGWECIHSKDAIGRLADRLGVSRTTIQQRLYTLKQLNLVDSDGKRRAGTKRIWVTEAGKAVLDDPMAMPDREEVASSAKANPPSANGAKSQRYEPDEFQDLLEEENQDPDDEALDDGEVDDVEHARGVKATRSQINPRRQQLLDVFENNDGVWISPDKPALATLAETMGLSEHYLYLHHLLPLKRRGDLRDNGDRGKPASAIWLATAQVMLSELPPPHLPMSRRVPEVVVEETKPRWSPPHGAKSAEGRVHSALWTGGRTVSELAAMANTRGPELDYDEVEEALEKLEAKGAAEKDYDGPAYDGRQMTGTHLTTWKPIRSYQPKGQKVKALS